MVKKVLSIATVIFILSQVMLFNAFAANKSSDVEEIKQILKQTLENRVNLAKENKLDEKYSTRNAALLEHEKKRAYKIDEALKKFPGKIVSTETLVNVKEIGVNEDTADAQAYEILSVVWIPDKQEVPADRPNGPKYGTNPNIPRGSNGEVTSSVGTPHKLKLEKKNNKWVIIKDEYNDGTWLDLKSPDYPGPIFINEQSERSTTTSQSSVTPMSTAVPYNWNDAIIYARTWVNPITPGVNNPDAYNNALYKNYNPYGGDCANYVSQCLAYGNQWMNSTWKYNDNGTSPWQTSDDTATVAWINNASLRSWIINANRGFHA